MKRHEIQTMMRSTISNWIVNTRMDDLFLGGGHRFMRFNVFPQLTAKGRGASQSNALPN